MVTKSERFDRKIGWIGFEWDFDIIHRKGTLNHVPNGLSRMYEDELEMSGFEIIENEWYLRRLEEVGEPPKISRVKD